MEGNTSDIGNLRWRAIRCCKNLLIVLCMLLPGVSKAQRYLGLTTSDWSAVNSVYLNPANIADCGEKVSIGIFSMNVLVDNNLGFIPKIPDIGNTLNNSDNVFASSQRKQFSMMVPAAEVRGPGIMVSVTDKISLAFTSDIRGIDQFNNFDPELYKVFAQPSRIPTGDYSAKAQNFNWTANLWSEVGLTFGAVVWEKYNHRLNFGVTVRRLGGIGYISVTGKNLDLDYKKDSNTFLASNSNIQFSSNVLGNSSTVLTNITPSGLFDKFFGESAGGGMSADIGFTYRYRIGEPEHSDYMESNLTHDLILSVAVTDIGAIKYYNSTDAVFNIKGNGTLGGQELKDSALNVTSVVNYAHQHGFNVDTANGARKVYLPVALVASGDVQIYGRFFVNLLYVANLANRNNFGNSYYDQITLTPRYDFHKMTIAMPLTYSALAHDFKAGLALRYSGFFVGSDDCLAAFSRYQYGFDFYFGGYIPIFKKSIDPLGLHWGY